MRPTGVPSRPRAGDSVHSTKLVPKKITVHAMTRTRARVRSGPVKARLSSTSTASAPKNQGLTTRRSTSGAAHASAGTATGFSIDAVMPRYDGSTTMGMVRSVRGATSTQVHTELSATRCHRSLQDAVREGSQHEQEPGGGHPVGRQAHRVEVREAGPLHELGVGPDEGLVGRPHRSTRPGQRHVQGDARGRRREQPHPEHEEGQDPDDRPAEAGAGIVRRLQEAADHEDVRQRAGTDRPERDEPDAPDGHTP